MSLLFEFSQRAILLLFLIGSVCATSSVDAQWKTSAKHPTAKLQPTAIGRAILDVTHFQGNKFFTGYGDYDYNSGPVHAYIYKARPTDQWIDDGRFQFLSDANYAYHKFGEHWFMPAFDPHPNVYGHTHARRDGKFNWTPFASIPAGRAQATHVFAFENFGLDDRAGTESLYAVGSLGAKAVVWKSSDNGDTWTEHYSITPKNPNKYLRFYWIENYNNRLYVQATWYEWDQSAGRISRTGSHRRSRVFEKNPQTNQWGWTKGPDVTLGRAFASRSTVYKGAGDTEKLVLLGNSITATAYSPAPLIEFDATTNTSVLVSGGNYVRDYTVDTSDEAAGNGHLYILTWGGQIRRTDALTRNSANESTTLWSERAIQPRATSIAVKTRRDVSQIRIVVGRSDSRMSWGNFPN